MELKNDIKITGTLKSVDQYLNIKLDDISVAEEMRYPHLSAVKNVFIRGSVVRYVHLPSSAVDVTLLEDAARRGMYLTSAPFSSLCCYIMTLGFPRRSFHWREANVSSFCPLQRLRTKLPRPSEEGQGEA